MLLPFTDGLMVSNRADYECAKVADRHYSRRTIGSAMFTGPGSDIVLRNATGTVLFVWVWHNHNGEQLERWDKETGYCCSLFRNESDRLASDIVREAEGFAVEKWGAGRAYTYVDPSNVRASRQPGRCFIKAGWTRTRTTAAGLIVLAKQLTSDKPKPAENPWGAIAKPAAG